MDIRTILQDFLTYDDTDRLVRDVSEALGCAVLVVNSAFRIVAYACRSGFADPVFLATVRRREMTYAFISMVEHWGDEQGAVYMRVQGTPLPRRVCALRHAGVRLGYLVCVDERGDLLQTSLEEFQMLEAMIAKQLIFEQHHSQMIANDAEAVLCNLLEGEYTSEANFQLQAATTYLADLKAERIALVNLEGYRNLNLWDDTLRSELRRAFYASHPFVYDGEVLMFLSSRHDCTQFESLAQQYRLRVVISDAMPRLYALPAAYHNARRVMECLLAQEPPALARVQDYHDLLMMDKLRGCKELMHPAVAALDRNDRLHGTEYCVTLMVYMLHGHSPQRTSEVLATHRNTILYRIEKMKTDFQIPLEDPWQRLALLLSSAMAVFAREETRFVRQMEGPFSV